MTLGSCFIPIRTSSTNAKLRVHWAKLRGDSKRERRVVGLVLAARFNKPAPGDVVRVTMKRIAPRALDDDNLRGALKAVRDEVAAFLGVDDGAKGGVEWAYAQAKGEPKQYGVHIAFEGPPEPVVVSKSEQKRRAAQAPQDPQLASRK